MSIPRPIAATAIIWLLAWLDATITRRLPGPFLWILFASITIAAVLWMLRSSLKRRHLARSLTFVPLAHFLYFSAAQLRWHNAASFFQNLAIATLFLIGLAWLIRFLEAQASNRGHSSQPTVLPQSTNHARLGNPTPPASQNKTWNPLNLNSKLYRPRSRRLDQSALALLSYVLIFLTGFILLTSLPGCDIYELPLGGGKPKPVQTVRLQKVIEKKYVINPYSVVKFNPPPIEKIQLQLLEATHHAYEVGYGEDDGAGFAGGTARGKVEFVRIQYDGGDWDQDLSNESDLNMLTEYQVRTGHRCAKVPKTRRISQLTGMPAEKSPAFAYITGQGNLITSKRDQEILREFVTERHGMIFADNGGSGGWHQQFFDLMRRVLPNIEPVRVPLDHPIHRLRYDIPFLPYVAPHGGKDAWGWVIEGRLAAYYHPGDIGDAWGNGHAGVRREIWEYCYQLGVNAMLYAHIEKSKWLSNLAKQEADKK